MRPRAAFFLAALTLIALAANGRARADDAPPAPGKSPKEQAEPAPKSAQEVRAELYARLAVSKDSDETDGLIGLLLSSYAQSGSDTADLLLQHARKAMREQNFDAARKILDTTVALLPDWPEGWNARATLRYLDDDFDGSMADIARTLKLEPRHLGALAGMAMILASRDKDEEALKVYERALSIAPHWRRVEDAAKELRATIAGQQI
jgi:tetratricopeptide (TPR) repeat protein